VPLQLEPWGSVFIVFADPPEAGPHLTGATGNGDATVSLGTDPNGDAMWIKAAGAGTYELTFADGATRSVTIDRDAETIPLDGPWALRFPHGWGFDPLQTFDSLIDWRNHPDPELAIYSGTATYKTSFTLNKNSLPEQNAFILDLGRVGEVARVYLNGKEVGTKVFPPFRFALDGLLREGANFLTVEVANTWLNQLIGEAGKPFAQQRTSSNLGRGDRTNAVRPWAEYEPQPSGLIGPVKLRMTPRVQVE
jgi:hypothetical protein